MSFYDGSPGKMPAGKSISPELTQPVNALRRNLLTELFREPQPSRRSEDQSIASGLWKTSVTMDGQAPPQPQEKSSRRQKFDSFLRGVQGKVDAAHPKVMAKMDAHLDRKRGSPAGTSSELAPQSDSQATLPTGPPPPSASAAQNDSRQQYAQQGSAYQTQQPSIPEPAGQCVIEPCLSCPAFAQ